MVSPIPNTIQRRLIQAGTEVVRGTAVTPEYRWYGNIQVNKRRPLVEREEYSGTRYVDYTPVYGPTEIDGTYAVVLSYQDLAILPRYGVVSAPAGVSDGETTPGFLYEYESTGLTLDLDTATLLHGFEGIVFRSTMTMFNEFTIRADIDDAAAAWQWDSRLFARTKDLQIGLEEVLLSAVTTGGGVHILTPTGGGLTIDALIGQYVEIMSGPGASQVALITDNDATTITVDRTFSPAPTTASTIEVSGEFVAAITDRDRDTIDAEGTLLFVADEGGALGDTPILGRFKAFSVTISNNVAGKRMMEDVGSYSAKLDVGALRTVAQITMEFDDWREVARWEEGATRLVRITQPNGPIIDETATPDPTRMTGRIDLPALYWEQVNEEVRNNNILATYQGRAYVDAVAGSAFTLASTIPDATLPGD